MRCLATGLLVGVLVSGGALASDQTEKQAQMDGLFDSVVYWGADSNYANSSRYGLGVDAGVVTAFNGDISAEGWTATASIGYSYSQNLPSYSNAVYGTLLLGYQWQLPQLYFSLSAGLNVVNNAEVPASPTNGPAVGAIIQYGLETKGNDTFYVQSYGSYSTANNQIYAHAKVGYITETLRFGPEVTISADGGNNPTVRYGAFLGGIQLSNDISMSASAGYQQEFQPGVANGMYATIGFSKPFSMR